MDEQSFQPGSPESLLHDQATVLMAGGPFSNKRGHAHLTNDRVLFMDVRFDPDTAGAVGGGLAAKLAERLERLRKERPPMVDLPLTDITRVWHQKKLTVRDIIVIEAASGETRFANGWDAWSPLLRRVLTERHGRTIADDGPDGWRVGG